MAPVPKDIPNTRFIDRVTNAAQVEYSQFGEGQVDLGPNRFIRVTAYRRVNVRIGSTQASEFAVVLGKIGGVTLAQEQRLPVDGNIHTFDISGPELAVLLYGGAPNTTESVQCWVYLTS